MKILLKTYTCSPQSF